MRDWSSDVCSSDLDDCQRRRNRAGAEEREKPFEKVRFPGLRRFGARQDIFPRRFGFPERGKFGFDRDQFVQLGG